jgi:hypothetical protein
MSVFITDLFHRKRGDNILKHLNPPKLLPKDKDKQEPLVKKKVVQLYGKTKRGLRDAKNF